MYCTYLAPPLTFDNVFEVMKTVRDWGWLAEELMGWYGSEGQKKLDAIKCQHISDDAQCLKAVVEAFLLGEGSYRPSWRMLIHELYWTGETSMAEKIKTNAEPQQGE